MLSCREVVDETMSDPELFEAGHSLSWSVRFHILMCHHCRRYIRHLRLLLKVLDNKESQQQVNGLEQADTVERVYQLVKKQSSQGPGDD